MIPLRQCQTDAHACIHERQTAGEQTTNLSLCTGAGKSRILAELTAAETKRCVLVFPWLDLLSQYIANYGHTYTTEVRYLATEGTLPTVQRLSNTFTELTLPAYTIFTTYTSAPLLYDAAQAGDIHIDILAHDEAHHVQGAEYAAALRRYTPFVRHTVNLSATLPSEQTPHYKYSLLRGIADGVVRDFHMELFVCVDRERGETALLATIVRKLLTLHRHVKLLIYTAEANTEGDDSVSSVRSFLSAHAAGLRAEGWWVEGMTATTTPKERQRLLCDFERRRAVSVLVSCRTLSEGIDLHGANCMMPWDPSSSVTVNIQRIGRVLRLYKDRGADEQVASTVLIPVFLDAARYEACDSEREAVNALLCDDIACGERGNFRPIVNVCTALKSELADDDADLFNRLLSYPFEPKVTVQRGLVDCVAAQCKKPVEDVLEAIVTTLGPSVDEEEAEGIRAGEWDEEIEGDIAQALATTQGITLVVVEGDAVDVYGTGEVSVTVERKGDTYKVVRGSAAGARKKGQKRVAERLHYGFSDGCKVMLGLETVEGADVVGGMMLSRITTEVQVEDNWEKRREEWAAVYARIGRNPSSISAEKDVKRAGQWQSQQRKFYKQKRPCLMADRIAALNATPGWSWRKEDTWEQTRQLWIQQYIKLGKKPSDESIDVLEKRAGQWQSQQRNNYKAKMSCMTPYRISTLESMPGWTWEREDTWGLKLQKWSEQYKKLGKFPSANSKCIDERKAGQWQKQQREFYKKSGERMTQDRIATLEATPGWTWTNTKKSKEDIIEHV